jgi:S1-C subfamily serine protease
MSVIASSFQIGFRLGLLMAVAVCAQAQVATRGSDGRLQVRRQNSGAFLGAYLGDGERGAGALVGKVLANSPAAKAGLQENDLLIELAAQRIENAAQVYQWLSTAEPAKPVALRIRRGTAVLTLTALLVERSARLDDPCQKLFSETNALFAEAERLKALADESVRKGDQKAAAELTKEAEAFFKQAELNRADVEKAIAEGRTNQSGRSDACSSDSLKPVAAALGAEVAPLTPQLAEHFSAPALGLLVTDVKVGSLAAQAGLKVGDCLLRIGDKVVTNSNELKLVFETALAADGVLTLAIVRQGKPQNLSITRR